MNELIVKQIVNAGDFKTRVNLLEMYASLEKACTQAGGDINAYNLTTLTVMDLVQALAPNGVRFICLGHNYD